MDKISVAYSSDEFKKPAMEFAGQNDFPCMAYDEITSSLVLNYTAEFVELRDTEKNISIHIDFISGDLKHRQQYGGGRGQTIAKAIGLKQGVEPPSVIDATAGLAKDAFVLACLGCPVTLLERSPIIIELLRDAIKRAENNDQFRQILNKGFEVIQTSSIDYLRRLKEKPDIICPDVIYLDPMFPDRKKSASVKKNMQLLQKLLEKDEDTEDLLNIALQCAKKRVVVKRPKGAATLSGKKPTYHLESKKTRYDIYIIPQ